MGSATLVLYQRRPLLSYVWVFILTQNLRAVLGVIGVSLPLLAVPVVQPGKHASQHSKDDIARKTCTFS
jgi:hypothetical protein